MDDIIDYFNFNGLFVNDEHKEAFYEAIEMSDTDNKDVERQSFFFIMTHNKFCKDNINTCYDFDQNIIKTDYFTYRNTYSSGEHSIIKLAFNLFNSYCDFDVSSELGNIDINSFEVCIIAMRIRFKRLSADYDKYYEFKEKIKKFDGEKLC